MGTELVAVVHQFCDIAMLWHTEPPADPRGAGSLADTARYLHALNFALWHHEDAVRRPGADDGAVARRKRCIDQVNARRNAAIEDIDAKLLADIQLNAGAPLHTETPGTIVDRLSVLALRIVHTAQSDQAGDRRKVLAEQYGDLLCGLEQFIARVRAGELAFKVYRQFKADAQRDYCDLFENSTQPQ
jgi:hypothetical protein